MMVDVVAVHLVQLRLQSASQEKLEAQRRETEQELKVCGWMLYPPHSLPPTT